MLALLPTLFVGMQALDQLRKTLNTDSRAFRAALVSDVADRVERILVDSSNTLVGVAQTLSNPALDHTVRVQVASTFLESDDLLDHVAIYGGDGSLIDVIRKEDATFDVPKEPIAKEILDDAAKNEVAFIAQGAQRVLGVVPIRVEEKVTGYVASYVPITKVQNKLRTVARELPSAKNSVYVIDRQRHIIAHPDEDTIGQTLSENTLRNNLQKDVTFEQLVTQSGEFVDDDGAEMVGSLKPLRFVDWAVVIETPIESVYASYYKTRDLVGVTILATVVLAIFLALLFARRLTAPIARLVAFSKRLAARDFDATTDVDSADELGVLSHAMQHAATDLKESEEAVRREIEIRSDLGRFLSKELVDGIVSREQDLELGGERQNISVLFADVVSFTAMCEDHDPAVVVEILNELFTILTEVVFKNGGTVDKFVGDCIMAFWGAPRPSDDHAEDAIAAAEEMMRFVDFGNERWKKVHGIKIELAIGVHSGVAIVGNVGSDSRMEYTAIGQTVNIAARMEALARPNQILTTGSTKMLVDSGVKFATIGEEKINSRGDSIEVYEVVQ